MPVSLPIIAIACHHARARAGQMRMRDGGRQRIGGIGLLDAAGGQQPLDHELHLLLAGMTGADHAFLDVVGRIFGDLQPRLRRRQQRHGAGMAELQRGGRIAGDKGLLDRDGLGRKPRDHGGQFAVQRHQPHAQAEGGLGGDDAMGDMGKPGASSTITPQPIALRPGSRPRIRIAVAPMAAFVPVLFACFNRRSRRKAAKNQPFGIARPFCGARQG